MGLPSMILAIAAATAGCYSPAYDDCQVGCADGTACPSGQACDTTLAVCRPIGMTGTCPAAVDDALVRQDGGDDADAGLPFCATVPGTPIVCHDFDMGPLDQQGWDLTAREGGGTLELVASDKSVPNALEAFTPLATAGVLTTAQLMDGFPPPLSFTSVRVAFDLKIVERSGPVFEKGAFRLTIGPNIVIDLVSYSVDQNYVMLNNNAASKAMASSTLGVWKHFEVRVTKLNNMFEISVFEDGLPYAGRTNGLIGTVGQTNVSMWQLTVGAAASSSTSAFRFQYDNVVVTAQ